MSRAGPPACESGDEPEFRGQRWVARIGSRTSPTDGIRLSCAIMTTIANCSNAAEAMLLKSLLEANAIPAAVPEEMTPDFTGSTLRVQVDDKHVDAAKRILAEAESGADAVEDDVETSGDAGSSH